MEIQLLIVLIIAFVLLGPERMMDLAIKLGEMMRKVRETWEEIRLQAYMEEVNKKIMEEESKELGERTEDETEVDEPLPEAEAEDYNEDYPEEEEISRYEHGEGSAPHDAPDGTPEGAENKTD